MSRSSEICEGLSEDYQEAFHRHREHAQMTFSSQPTRRFLRGFYIRVPSNKMELWIFDRAGQFLLESFDIREVPNHFISVMTGFLGLNDDELGLDTFIQNDELGKYVLLNKNKDTEEERVYLENEPIFSRKGIVAEGAMACYRAKRSHSKRWEFVAKFVWRLETDRPEEKLLAITKERKAWGVVQLWDHQVIDSIASLRQTLGCNTTEGTPGNRIFSCVIITPYGRPLWQFTTTLEFLMTFRDAIKAHKSLYQDGKLLHQDISPDNIAITETDDGRDPQGALIDLDLAMEMDVGPGKEGELIGTKPFMAIGVLRRDLHTYRPIWSPFFMSSYGLQYATLRNPPQRQANYNAGSKGAGVIWQRRRSVIWEKTNSRRSLPSSHLNFRTLEGWRRGYVR
jgi:Fungal protein kinase